MDAPAARGRGGDGFDGGAEANVHVVEGRHHAVDEPAHAARESEEEARRTPRRLLRSLRLAPAGPHRADQTPVAALTFGESRKSRTQAQGLGVPGIDSGHQRLGDPLESLPAQPPEDEGRKALVVVVEPRADESLHDHSELARPGEEGRGEQGPDGRWHREDEALGQGVEALARQDVDAPGGGLGPDQVLFDAKLSAKLPGPGLLCEEGVRATFDKESVPPLCDDATP